MKKLIHGKSNERYVEIGRMVLISFGPSQGKFGIIIDILDKNRYLIDGPLGRQIINSKRLKISKIKIKIGRSINSRKINEILRSQGLIKQWEMSKWMQKKKKIEKIEKMNDFEKFKYMLGKKMNRHITQKK